MSGRLEHRGLTMATIAIVRHALLAIGTLLASAPWGLPQNLALLTVLLLAAYVALASLRPGPKLAYAGLFCAGVVIDAVSFAPLGYSSVLLLLARASADLFANRLQITSWFAQVVSSAVVLGLVAAAGWAITSA